MESDTDHMRVLTEDEYRILTYIEDQWLRKELFPSLAEIARKTHIDQVKVVDALSSDLFKKSLDALGIPQFTDIEGLTEKQIVAINLVLNPSDNRSVAAKLRAIGVSPVTYNGWKRQKHFMEAMRNQGEKLFGQTQPEVHAALVKQALQGDMQAIKYYNQMSGRFDSSRTVEHMNVQLVMTKLLETIQKHVKDPVALSAIAEEFSGLLGSTNQQTRMLE